ncbi:unnamed protein product, partial [Mesorhabditis spiculigera]
MNEPVGIARNNDPDVAGASARPPRERTRKVASQITPMAGNRKAPRIWQKDEEDVLRAELSEYSQGNTPFLRWDVLQRALPKRTLPAIKKRVTEVKNRDANQRKEARVKAKESAMNRSYDPQPNESEVREREDPEEGTKQSAELERGETESEDSNDDIHDIPRKLTDEGDAWLQTLRRTLPDHRWTHTVVNAAVYARPCELNYTGDVVPRETAPPWKVIAAIRKNRKAGIRTVRHLEASILDVKLRKENKSFALKRDESDRQRIRSRVAGTRKQLHTTTGNIDHSQVLATWEQIFGRERKFTKTNIITQWLKDLDESLAGDEVTEDRDEVRRLGESVVKKMKGRKAPGPDGIRAIWWQKLPTARLAIFTLINRTLDAHNPSLPRWLTEGRTLLLPKCDDPKPDQYRPICLLNTQYKVITGVLTAMIAPIAEMNQKLLPITQKAIRKGVSGCLESHLTDRSVLLDAKLRKRGPHSELWEAWLDFAKAFDSISHAYLLELVDRFPIRSGAKALLRNLIKAWEVKIILAGHEIGKIRIRSGILQGDSLSPLLFCIAVAPISYHLNKMTGGYTTETRTVGQQQSTFNHLYYIDDLKLFAHSEAELARGLRIVQDTGQAMGLWINPGKSAYNVICANPEADGPDVLEGIPKLKGEDGYRYLGIYQRGQTAGLATVSDLKKTIGERTREIVHTQDITSAQIIARINQELIPKAEYVFSMNQLLNSFEQVVALTKKLERITMESLTEGETKLWYQTAAKNRIYVDREDGGLGLRSFAEALQRGIFRAFVHLVLHPNTSELLGIHCKAERQKRRSLISDFNRAMQWTPAITFEIDTKRLFIGGVEHTTPETALTSGLATIRSHFKRYWLESWHQVEGRAQRTDTGKTLWLEKGWVAPNVTRVVTAVQSERIIEVSSRLGRKCPCGALETAEHISNQCERSSFTTYMRRHDAVARSIYKFLAKKYGVETVHYSKCPPPESRGKTGVLWWDVKIPARDNIYHTRPDIVLFIRSKDGTGGPTTWYDRIVVIEIAVAWPDNMELAKNIKTWRYTVNGEKADNESTAPLKGGPNICLELAERYHAKVDFIPLVIGACGEVPEYTREAIRRQLGIGGKVEEKLAEQLSRAAACGTYYCFLSHFASTRGPPIQG